MFRSSRDIILQESRKEVDNSEPIKYRCDFCTDEYLSESEVEVHRKSTHNAEINDLLHDVKKIVCKICVTELSSWDSLLKHIKSVHFLSSEDAVRIERDIYVCDYCNQLFFNKLLLAAHVIRNHMKSDRRITFIECPKCNKNVRVNNLWYHFQTHEIQRSSCCPICMMKCKDMSNMREHANSHPYCFRCDMCLYETKNRLYFQQHIEKHDNCVKNDMHIKENLLKECFVPKKCLTPWKYRPSYGLRGITLPEKIHICVLCREICTDRGKRKHLLKHLPSDAPKKKRHICACGGEFFNNVLLKHHIFKLKGNHRVVEDKIEESNESQSTSEGFQEEIGDSD